MAVRRPISCAIRLSNALNTIGCERGAAPSAALILKKTNQNYQTKQISTNTHQIPSTRTSPGLISLSADLLRTSESERFSQEYQCPSRLANKLSQMVIVDKQTNKSDYHLPLATTIITSLIDPQQPNEKSEIKDPASQHTQAKEAKEIMRIRHKKMKKHKLKKLRKRMYFVWRKQKLSRKAKRDTIFWKDVADIKKEGDDFDAETFVKGQLDKARRGGYYINVFESKA